MAFFNRTRKAKAEGFPDGSYGQMMVQSVTNVVCQFLSMLFCMQDKT